MDHKFNIGDTIEAIFPGRGLEEARILSISDEYYHCKISGGISAIPIISEVNYKLKEGK